MKVHELKTDPEMYDAILDGHKTAEFRRDDRGFESGDTLVLWRNGCDADDVLHYIEVRVTHVVKGPAYGIPAGYAMLSFSEVSEVVDT